MGFALGVVEVVDRDAEDTVVGHLGPDLLGPDWDEDEALRRLRADPARPVAEAILDQRNLAGLGNLYKNELCFLAGVHPWLPVAEVPDLPRLVRRARSALEANKGRVEQTLTGDTRRGHQHWVYRRERQPCRRCGTRIRVGPPSVPRPRSGRRTGARPASPSPRGAPTPPTPTSADQPPRVRPAQPRGGPGGTQVARRVTGPHRERVGRARPQPGDRRRACGRPDGGDQRRPAVDEVVRHRDVVGRRRPGEGGPGAVAAHRAQGRGRTRRRGVRHGDAVPPCSRRWCCPRRRAPARCRCRSAPAPRSVGVGEARGGASTVLLRSTW